MAAPPPAGSILIVDAYGAEALRAFTVSAGYEAEIAASPAAALQAVAAGRFDTVLMDIDYATGGTHREDLLAAVTALDRDLPVIVVTPIGSTERATEAIGRGARDFIRRPWDPIRLTSVLRNMVELRRALAEIRRLESQARV